MAAVTTRHIASVIVQQIAKPGAQPQKIAAAVAQYLVEERRTRDLPAIMRAVQDLRAKDGLYEVTATSAFPLDHEIKREIKGLVAAHVDHAKTVIVDEERDETVIGGVRIANSELLLDTTAQHKLRQLIAASGT